ncbi:DNA sulfur modification protein DndD [Streptomyces sp. UH6]|uniref:DNA sulfur modification protein DndD n=1 Tax=Streptomyces sp. UH6 TaxID=2748379 RepID=UPI0015D4EC17|nr:DNA sulfur modification protein DndD [Streptomyces sp. UH6]NYV73208.1 DNA sulfur modification protein DndD [Streptomyces sp. UH6]
MLLHNITLEEFGAYRGKQTLDLTVKKNKPIILIGGLNGCGKTTLLDAIQLVLYGPRARCSGRGGKAYETYLRESINRQHDPARGSSVTLEFTVTTDAKEHYYRVIRSWHTSGKSLKEFLTVLVDDDYRGEPTEPDLKYSRTLSEGWADHVEDLLPLEVASLSFFDGEKIESLADPERASSVIESAVNSLLGVNTVEQLRTDLLALQRRQKLSEEEQHLLEDIRAKEQERDAVKAELKQAAQQLEDRQSTLADAMRELERIERTFEKEGGSLFERRVELEQSRKEAGERLADLRAALGQLAAGTLPFVIMGKQLDELRAQAEREQRAAESRQVLGVLEVRDQWLLSLLPEETQEAALAKLEEDRQQRASSVQLEIDLGLPSDMTTQIAALDEGVSRDQERAAELLGQISATAEDVAQLDRQLAGVPEQSKVEAIQKDRDEQLKACAAFKAAIARDMERIEELKRRLEHVDAALGRAHDAFVRTKVKAEEVERVIKYSEKARETLQQFGQQLLEAHISRLEVAVLESFGMLMRKQSLVKDLRIGDGFKLTLADANGEPIEPGRLSAGERQLLAVSLLWGLMKVAGSRLPSVIDTPLGRLDSRHRQHLTDRYFPHASDQVLLLSTDEEIDETLLNRLQKSVARTYTLVHDDTQLTTSVVEGYWWNAGAQNVA